MRKKLNLHLKKNALHEDLGLAKGTPIPMKMLAKAKRSSSPLERKRATFAENARKWNHTGHKKK